MTLSEAIENFIIDRRLRYYTDKTIQNYKDVLSLFIRFVGDRDLSEVNVSVIKAYTEYLIDKRIRPASVATYLRHIKAFFSYLESESIIAEGSIKRHIKLPKTPKKKITLYSPEDMQLIFESVKEESEWLIIRDRLAIALMYDSGLRQAEVCKIMYNDLDFKRNIILIHGKGNKDRFVPFGTMTLSLLNQYMTLCPYSKDYIMCDRRGNQMTENAVKKFMSKLRALTGIDDLSSHKLRHNFATNWCIDKLKKNGTPDSLQLMVIMGHEDLTTTEKYIHEAYQLFTTSHFDSHLDLIMGLKS